MKDVERITMNCSNCGVEIAIHGVAKDGFISRLRSIINEMSEALESAIKVENLTLAPVSDYRDPKEKRVSFWD